MDEMNLGKQDPLPEESPNNLGPGARLKVCRESQGISIQEVSSYLQLTESVLEKLEKDDYDTARGFVYVKGYLRAYATMLGENPDEFIQAFNQLGLNDKHKEILEPEIGTRGLETSPMSTRWLTYFFVAGIFVLVGIWWNSHHKNQTTVAATSEELPKKSVDNQTPTPQKIQVNQTEKKSSNLSPESGDKQTRINAEKPDSAAQMPIVPLRVMVDKEIADTQPESANIEQDEKEKNAKTPTVKKKRAWSEPRRSRVRNPRKRNRSRYRYYRNRWNRQPSNRRF